MGAFGLIVLGGAAFVASRALGPPRSTTPPVVAPAEEAAPVAPVPAVSQEPAPSAMATALELPVATVDPLLLTSASAPVKPRRPAPVRPVVPVKPGGPPAAAPVGTAYMPKGL